MAVILELTGVKDYGRVDQHTVPDGSTIAINRTPDGFLSIVVSLPTEPKAVAEETDPKCDAVKSARPSDRADQKLAQDHPADGDACRHQHAEATDRSTPEHAQDASLGDLRKGIAQAILTGLRELSERQTAAVLKAMHDKPATEDEAVRDAVRQALASGASILVVERGATTRKYQRGSPRSSWI